jgi:peptide/nickel transport system ATP-binding protein
MSQTVLEVKNLRVEFLGDEENLIAVDEISFTLNRGETLGIVGESGSGKSVTSLAIMALLPSNTQISGEIWFNSESEDPPQPPLEKGEEPPQPPLEKGEEPPQPPLVREEKGVNLLTLSEREKREFRGGKIGMIFQEPMSSLNPVYNIGFQITEALKLHKNLNDDLANTEAIRLLQEVKLLPSDEELKQQYLAELKKDVVPDDNQIKPNIEAKKQAILKRYPHELSGGQLQRVMIAMAISCDPSILIADEPTTALDVTVQATILQLLRELCQTRQMSLIFITHDLGVIANIADKIAVMCEGKIVEFGIAQEIFRNPTHPYTQGLLACRPRLDIKTEYLPTVADFMAKMDSEEAKTPLIALNRPHREKINQGEPLMKVENLKVAFGKKGVLGWNQEYFLALKGVSFEVNQGETLGLVGESGCGKSTLAKAILRLIPTFKGEVKFLEGKGQNLLSLPLNSPILRKMRRNMQIVFQNPYNSLNPRLSIGSAIMEPMMIHQWENQKQRLERVSYLLDRVGLDPSWFNRYPHELSGGQRQRVCIARALALNPKLVICDESVSALDVSVQAQVLNLLKELQAEFGLTYIFISHDLSVVKFMSDRIMVMNQGQIEEMGTATQIIENPQTEYTQKLIASIPQIPQ